MPFANNQGVRIHDQVDGNGSPRVIRNLPRTTMCPFRRGGGTIAPTPINGGTVMAMRILWPNLPAQFVPIASEAVGPGFETEFHAKFEDVTDEQWANADAI